MIEPALSLALRPIPRAVIVVAVAALVAACTVASASAALVFPAKPPSWLVRAVTRTATGLGDPKAVVSASLGRFPIVVIKGDFVCNSCSHGPADTAAPTGRYASLRFDALTHQVTDFSLAKSYKAAISSLCSGGACRVSATYLYSALRALDAHSGGVDEPFDHRFGRSQCKIRLPVPEMRWIWGECSVLLANTSRGLVVTFRESWNGLDARGKRYAADSPRHHHLFRVSETTEGFVTRFVSTGDWPPQSRR